MKKTKRAAILIATAVLACGAVAFSACESGSGSDGGVKVSESQWQERLTIEIESYDSLTVTSSEYSTYPKEQAAEYGNWELNKEITQVDNKAQIICYTIEREKYSPDDKNAVDGFVKTTTTEYTFCYNEKYYSWNESDKDYSWNPYGVTELTKAEFIRTIESVSSEFAMLSMYANEQVYKTFNYNSKTNTYEIVQGGGFSMGIQFPKSGGVKLINQMTSIEKYELSIEKLNSTTVTVPKQVYDDVDAFLAAKNN